MKTSFEQEALGDARLVELCLEGSRDAFGSVVARYQSLICGIAYSACGDLERSEDLAQDTFVTAWQKLATLEEPGKLKGWLCGIVRNLVNNARRREPRVLAVRTDMPETEVASGDALPDEQAMSKEEEALVWNALETIPEGYREAMVLFYRECRSARMVAEALDISEEAVRQRLSRGRAMLNERLAKTVETALLRTAPGKAFTLGVLAALPSFTLTAKAATLGAVAVEGGAAAKTAATTGLVGSLLSPVLFACGMWMGYRLNVDAAETDAQRQLVRAFYRRLMACILGFGGALFILLLRADVMLTVYPGLFLGLLSGLLLAYLVLVLWLTRWVSAERRKLKSQEAGHSGTEMARRAGWEYRSSATLLGLPLMHLRLAGTAENPVTAWIAVGGQAYGVLFAFGGLAVAPVSIGGLAVGLLAFGGLGIGALVLAGLGIGVWSFAGTAVGWQAFGGCALAWDAAQGGIAIAHDHALGGVAYAAEANSGVAETFMRALPFFRWAAWLLPYVTWLNFVWIVPLLVQWRLAGRLVRMKSEESVESHIEES